MIIIKVRNGLGNQLFEYAIGVYIQEKYPSAVIKYDFSNLPYYIGERYTIKFTEIINDVIELSPKEIRKILGKFYYLDRPYSDQSVQMKVSKRVDKILQRFGGCYTISEHKDYWNIDEKFVQDILHIKLDLNKNYILDGVWENIEYILPIRKKIIASLAFDKIKIDEKLIKKITNCNSVSIHIRRGDYVKESYQREYPRNYYMICEKSYYLKAIEIVNKNVENPIFVFFSDDLKFIDSEFSDVKNKIVVHAEKDYEDLYLMRLCKHHILANSTFSFWGAFLDEKKGIVIAPSTHYIRLNNENENVVHPFFYVDGWKYIGAEKDYEFI